MKLGNGTHLYFKEAFFCFGLCLTMWRSYGCLQKYLNNNLSTKVKMVNSFETFRPVFVVCPSSSSSYKLRNLKKLGIKDASDYRQGNWYGNSSMDGKRIFKYVTHELFDLIKSMVIYYNDGKEDHTEPVQSLNVKEIGYKSNGRCFEIRFWKQPKSIFYVHFTVKERVKIYLNLPHRLHYEDSKSKLDVKLGETLMIEVTYELLKNNHGKHCRQYGNDDVNFDSCMTYEFERKIQGKLNCTVPYVLTSDQDVCMRKSDIEECLNFLLWILAFILFFCILDCKSSL